MDLRTRGFHNVSIGLTQVIIGHVLQSQQGIRVDQMAIQNVVRDISIETQGDEATAIEIYNEISQRTAKTLMQLCIQA